MGPIVGDLSGIDLAFFSETGWINRKVLYDDGHTLRVLDLDGLMCLTSRAFAMD